jgi:hypothetical protein
MFQESLGEVSSKKNNSIPVHGQERMGLLDFVTLAI